VQPYLALIQSEGGTPAAAVQSLLNTAYILRTGSPQAKQQALMGVARQFGVELNGIQHQQAQVHPEIAALQNEIAQLRGSLSQRELAEQQQTQAEIGEAIQAFAADPSHAHFEEVKAHMAALLREGLAKDLQDAYDQACHARPDIRATLLAQQRAEEEQKRRSEEKARAEAARNKAVSITGGPGIAAARSAPESRSLREELEANFRAAAGAV
jgi:DNA primase